MTRQEFIKKALEFRREGKSYASDLSCRDIHPEGCSGCPYSENIYACHDMYTDDLLDRIIELEDVVQVFSGMEKGEHHETNLEHYVIGYRNDETGVMLRFDDSCKHELYKLHDSEEIERWFLSIYQEKYYMSRLCYDVLKRFVDVASVAEMESDVDDIRLYDVLLNLEIFNNEWIGVKVGDLFRYAEVIKE